MFERLAYGWELTKASYRCLMLDKELLVFPLVSGLACLLVLGSFALPLAGSDYLEMIRDEGIPTDPLAYVILFLFYAINYFVVVFFNSALIACAIVRFKGGDPTLADGFRAAFARLPQIFGWALVSATVGIILKAIESRSERVGQIVAGLVGMAWSAASYFVVPVLVVENVGPFEALKRSLSILRKTWGEALVANFSIGLIVFVLVLAALIPLFFGISVGGTFGIFCLAITVVLLILFALVTSALHGILVGALYLYAVEGRVAPQFEGSRFDDAFARR